MADKFTEALEELKDALTNGEELEAALVAVAVDHDVRPEALRNRATLMWGDLAAYREQRSANAAHEVRYKIAVERQMKNRSIRAKNGRNEKLTPEELEFQYWYFCNNLIADEDYMLINQR